MTTAAARPRSWLWLQGLVCGAALSFATGSMLLVTVLLAPGLACYMLERTPGKPASEAMLLLGLSTVFMPVRLLWEHGHDVTAALDLLGDPARVGLSWLAGAAGWVMGEWASIGARTFSDIAAKHQIAALMREREMLVPEWGRLDAQRTPNRV